MSFSYDVIYELSYVPDGCIKYTVELHLKEIKEGMVHFTFRKQTFDVGGWDRTSSSNTFLFYIDAFEDKSNEYTIKEKYHKKDYPEYFL